MQGVNSIEEWSACEYMCDLTHDFESLVTRRTAKLKDFIQSFPHTKVYITLIIPINEGGQIVWEFREGYTKLLCTMKLVPPKDPGSIVHPSTIH